MNKTQLFVLFLLSASFASYTYSVDVDRSGFSSVTLSLESSESVDVALPQDASNFRIVGGSYQVTNGSAAVSAGASGLATFSFSTSTFTAKTDSGWKLSFYAPEGALARIYLPPYASLENSFPAPEKIASDDSRIVLETQNPKQVTVYYRLGEPPPAGENADYSLPAAILAVLLAAAIVPRLLAHFELKPRAQPATVEKAPTLALTPGKKEMMETLNETDLKIINHLLSSAGKSRRNELERKTGISKSSLAMALNRMEKRKLIEMDRTSTTHFVKLSDYFLRL